MGLLNNIFATIFYILFFTWLFIKIRNIIMIKKINCSIKYKDYKKALKKHKTFKLIYLIVFIFLVIITVNYFFKMSVFLLLSVFTLGGIMYNEAGGDSTSYNNLAEDTIFGFYSIFCIWYIFVYIFLVKAIYRNILYYKMLKDYPNSITEENNKY